MLYSLLNAGEMNGMSGSPLILLLILAVCISTAAYVVRKIIQNRKHSEGGCDFPAMHYLPDDPAVFHSRRENVTDMPKYICRQCGYVSFEEISYCPDCGCCDISSYPPGAKPDDMHLFCPRCGTLVRCTDRFCFRCGTMIE